MPEDQFVFRVASDALLTAGARNAARLAAAAELLRPAPTIWVAGLGKSGLVARKMAGMLNSLGRRAAWLHPVDALHGDAGAIGPEDRLVAISQSGHTAEVLRLVRTLSLPTVAVCSEPSPLAAAAAVCLDSRVEQEAGGAVPSTSFVVAVALVDAVALALGGEVRHPGGYIGAMSRPVKDYMLPPPIVPDSASALEVIPLLGHGAVLVDSGGIFTDGDLRRAAGAGRLDRPVGELCTRAPVTVEADDPARVAIERMERRSSQISVLPVVALGRYVGIVRLHDLVRAGLGA